MNPRPMAAAALAAAVLVSSLLAAPASAAPPVAVDDEITVWANGSGSADVLANDSDPDGDELSVCRIGEISAPEVYASAYDGASIEIYLFGNVGDTVTITYYACDFETLVPATLTINVKKAEPIRVAKLDRPGVLRVTNPNDRQIRFLWGTRHEPRPDGRVQVPANDSVVIRVHRHQILWAAVIERYNLIDSGRVRDIELPADDRGLTARREPLPAWPAGVAR